MAYARRLDYDAYLRSAKIYLGLSNKDYRTAAQMLDSAIYYYPDRPPIEAHYILGTIYSDKRLYSEMVEQFNYVIAMCDTAENEKVQEVCEEEKYMKNIQDILASNWIELYNDGVSTLKYARSQDSTCQEMTDSVQKAGCMSNVTDSYQRALEYFQNATLILPDSAQAWVNIGLALFELGEVDSALNAYSRAIEFNPEDKNLLINIGSIYFNRGQYDSAAAYFDKLMVLDIPDQNRADILYNMALCLNQMDNVDSSVVLFEKVVELNPESEDALYNLGAFRIKSAANLSPELNKYRDSVQTNKAKYQPMVDSLEAKLKELYSKAAENFEDVVKINPNNVDALEWLGNAYFYMEEWDKSLEAFEKLIAIEPDHEEAACQLLLIYLKKNNKAKIDEYKEKCPRYQ